VTRLSQVLYLASLALLPWSWFPPFPWLHEHAQWSDVVFALAAGAWLLDRARAGSWPRLRAHHAAMAGYCVWAAISHLAAGFEPRAGSFKLLGMAELAVLAIITEDFASRPGGLPAIAKTIAWTSLATGVAALAGVLLHQAGIATPLVSHPGDLEPGSYARARAGFPLPNLLASFAIAGVAIVGHPGGRLPAGLRRAAQAALAGAAVLSMSRGVLGLVLAVLVRRATTSGGRAASWIWALASAATLAALTIWNIALDPTRPWDARLRQEPSSRQEALASSAHTLAAHPFTGTGPGTSPGSYAGTPFDAHVAPLNVAATLGLPALAALVSVPLLLWRRRSQPTDLAVWGGLAGMALDALAQDVEDFRHLWILFGLAGMGRRRLVFDSNKSYY
jgi:hypothetical protein